MQHVQCITNHVCVHKIKQQIYNTIQYNIIHYNMIEYNTVIYNIK